MSQHAMTITSQQLRAFGRDANGKPMQATSQRKPRGTGAKSVAKRVSLLESKFARLWEQLGGPELVREYLAVPGRKFRWDFAHVQSRTLVEIQGGIFGGKSGHNTGKGIERDAEKSREAQQAGWVSYPLTTRDLTADNVERLIGLIGRRLKMQEQK